LREALHAKIDEVFGLQNRKHQLQMSMDVSIYLSIYIHTYIYILLFSRLGETAARGPQHQNGHIYIYIYTYVHIYIYLYTYTYTYRYMHAYIYVHIYICVSLLQVKRFREALNAKMDEVFGLQNRKHQLQMLMDERAYIHIHTYDIYMHIYDAIFSFFV